MKTLKIVTVMLISTIINAQEINTQSQTLTNSSNDPRRTIISLVKEVRADQSGFGYIEFVNEIGNKPACVNDRYRNALAFDTNTAGGQSLFSLALTAKSTGKQLFAQSTATCSIYGVIESINYARILQD